MRAKTVRPAVIFALLVAVGGLVALRLVAQRPPQTSAPLERLREQFDAELRAKNYRAAARSSATLLAVDPDDRDLRYDRACALARLDDGEEALGELTALVNEGFDEVDLLEHDEDLASLRGKPSFQKLLAQARDNDRLGHGPIEPAQALEGVKTVERAPEFGLRYRLRLPPDASAARPARLVLWLHPSGGSGNEFAESLVRLLVPQRFALLLPVQKDWSAWTDHQFEKLLGASLADAAKVEGVDVRLPVLLGYSAGGQEALQQWRRAPGRFGGLVLVAAYPVDRGPVYTEAQNVIMDYPDAGSGSAPIFVVVGDEGETVWASCEKAWGGHGQRLTLVRSPGVNHLWAVTPQVEHELDGWLAQLRAAVP